VKDAISIADLVALVTVAGVSVYVAGLLGLAIAIRLRLTDDMGTAWYAVSLLPRTDVAGQGVRIWLSWPLPIAVVVVVLDTLGEDIGAFVDTATFDPLISLSGLVVLGLFAVRILRRLDYEKVTERHSHSLSSGHYILSSGHYIAAIVTAAVGGLLMSIGALRVVQGAREATLTVLQALTHGVFSGTIFFLVGGLFVGVAGTAVLDTLPHVLIEPDPTAVNLPALKGSELYLVTHAEGHWHFLDDASNALLSVPDRLVWSVHTFKKPPKAPNEPAVKKGGERKKGWQKWWQGIVEFFGY
jgi:hypothetical protein